MNVLSVGSDRNIFRPQSENAARQIAYGSRFESLDLIVFSRASQKLSPTTLSIGVHVHPTASRSRLFYIWDAFRIAWKLGPDVITVQDPFEAGIAGLLIAWWHQAPLHVQVHTDFLAPEFRRSSLNRLRVLMARFVLPRAARIRVVSERIRNSLHAPSSELQAPITVLPIFVDIAKYRDAKPGELSERFAPFKKRMLVVSRLEEEKDVALAIRSFEAVAPEDTCLVIVGDGSERQRLEKMAGPKVFFEGEQDAAPYYAIADLVLVTSRYEGYGRTIIEAFAAGKPVLSTDVGIAREAGAIVASGEKFPMILASWFEEGMREGKLLNYPYHSFDAYARMWAEDVAAAAHSHKAEKAL